MPDWRELSPETLILDPTVIPAMPGDQMAAEAMRYSRAAAASYDEIGFRMYAVSRHRGPIPLQTIQGMRLARQNDEATRPAPFLAELLEQEELLRHRPIELPSGGPLRYTVDSKRIYFRRRRTEAPSENDDEIWTFPLGAPPQSLLPLFEPRDEPPIAAQQLEVEIPGVFWIPLALLLETGRLPRMQEWRHRLVTKPSPRNFYCFISHRWLAPEQPDPVGAQAALLGWQLLGHLAEAVLVCKRRGLNQPRKFFRGVGFPMGVRGSSLAEALIVNVLRMALDQELLDTAAAEVSRFEGLSDDHGVASAQGDPGLLRLREQLGDLPVLAALVDRIFIWYDYSSMPQPPRTSEEETTFREGLKYLNAIQILGRTAILLDEAEDYLSRGWCTLESLAADSFNGIKDLLVGSKRSTAQKGAVEHYFDTLLEDRPHLVWRAVLDTEVFRVQSADQCLARLQLAVTDPRDIPFIYQGLVRLGAPGKIHTDDSEILTGVFPLPIANGEVVLPKSTARSVGQNGPKAATPKTLDWSGALSLVDGRRPQSPPPSWVEFSRPEDKRSSCHVAIVAGCEGEAVLAADWICQRLGDLETELNTTVKSLSWLASDIAPVGHMIEGRFRTLAVDADIWVLVAGDARLHHCLTTGALQNALLASGHPYFELTLDSSERNLIERAAADVVEKPESFAAMPVQQFQPISIAGGIFRSALLEHLAGSR